MGGNQYLSDIKRQKKYKTTSIALSINVSKKITPKSVISLKRGSSKLSWALTDKKLKTVEAKVSNPKKIEKTDVLNHSQLIYKSVLKNTDITYDIYPEKIQEIITIKKKQENDNISFQIDCGDLKVKVKNKKVYFQTAKGITKYTRLKTTITDDNGVSTTNVKISYNKKKKVLTLTPSKKWWNSAERKFPLEVRTSYTTSNHSRDIKVGAAYAGAPNGSFGYDKSLLLQSGKCVAFVKSSTLPEIKTANVKILAATLNITNETKLTLGAGKTFDVGIHKVKESWSAEKVTYNNQPVYETVASSTTGMQKKGSYQCDVTDIVKDWYAGEKNYGVALVADNTNRTWKARLDRTPSISIRYEIVGFDGAAELKEGEVLTRDVLISGQENYYYFDPEPGVAYELYSEGEIDTQAVIYDNEKKRLGYNDNNGLLKNFRFVSGYNGRRYLKVSTKGTETGTYRLILKKHFAIADPLGEKMQDGYHICWDAIENATSYLVTIYDANGVIDTIETTSTSYEYIYKNNIRGKTLAFTVTPMESKDLIGESSGKIYNTASNSKWQYAKPMTQARERFASAVCNEKLYVLGGIDTASGGSVRTMESYDPDKQVWKSISDYPEEGIYDATMLALGEKLYIFGGQIGTETDGKLIKATYCYNTESGLWTKLADMPEGRSKIPAAACNGKIYLFAKAGSTERIDIYDPAENTWKTNVTADTSINIQAQEVNGRIFVLREGNGSDINSDIISDNTLTSQMYVAEYLPEIGEYANAGAASTIADADSYLSGTVANGKIYMVNDKKTDQIIYYDVYLDKWDKLSVLNLKKEHSNLAVLGGNLYSLGGTMQGFGTIDVTETYNMGNTSITKQLKVTESESYELQINAGNCEEDTDYIVTVHVDPEVIAFSQVSSFLQKEEMKKGQDGIQLIQYAPKEGVIVLRLRGKMENDGTIESCQSIPVIGVKNGNTVIKMFVEKDN